MLIPFRFLGAIFQKGKDCRLDTEWVAQCVRPDDAINNLRRVLMFFAGELDALGSKMPSLTIAELEQALIVSFICNNPNNYSTFLEDRTRPAASWRVRRAE